MSESPKNFDELIAGSEPEPIVIGPITRTDFVRYQGASGDMNPVHHDERFAQKAGFKAPLGIGMYHAGVLSTWATHWLGPQNIRSIKLRWKQSVWPGDTLSCGGKITRKYEENGEKRVDLELFCTNQNDEITVQAWASFVVPTKE
jgi:acyl dehydratase